MQVALRQSKPGAPPGFEDEESPGSAVPPPGFDAKPAVRSPPGYSRATNGFSKTPSPAKVRILSFSASGSQSGIWLDSCREQLTRSSIG